MATEKRLIDANALMCKARWMEEPDGNGIPCDIMAVSTIAIVNAPTVDAVEVVRCKDCKHWCYEYDDVGLCVTDVPDIDGVQRYADDFCSYGERKGNDI